jgi:hypothetical protein
MDESKPPIPPSEGCRRSASERTSTAIDPVPAKSAGRAAAARQSCVGQVEVRQTDPTDEPSVAVYYRNEAEVREGFLIALSAMGDAIIEQIPEPAKPAVRSAKP